jgi:hypothetical protein
MYVLYLLRCLVADHGMLMCGIFLLIGLSAAVLSWDVRSPALYGSLAVQMVCMLSCSWALACSLLCDPLIRTEDWAEESRGHVHSSIFKDALRQHMYAQRVDGALSPDATFPGGVNARMEWGVGGRAGWSSTGDAHFTHLLDYVLRESGCTRRRQRAAQFSQPVPTCFTGYTMLYTTGGGHGEDASADIVLRYRVNGVDNAEFIQCRWREDICQFVR